MPTPHFVSLDDAAETLDCSKRHLRRLIADGKLPAYTVGTNRVIRIDRDDLKALLQPVVPTRAR
jgi:excisionase family DNA binding protein